MVDLIGYCTRAVVAAVLVFSCAAEVPESYQDPATERMAKRLAEIEQNLNPATNTYINAARVEYLQMLEQPPDIEGRLRASAYLARERLRAGQSTAAIAAFAALKPQLAQVGVHLTPDIRVLLGLAHLRLGEEENCLAGDATASCLLPISADGIHAFERGSRSALEEFTAYLNENPDDLSVRWLLNIAYMTLGKYPAEVPEQWLVPPEVFASTYDIKRFRNVAPGLGLDLVSMAGGGIMDDFDGDGYLDIMASSWGLRDQIRYFANRGDGTFDERTAVAGLTGIVGGLQIVHADYDNNGYIDVLVLRGGWWEGDGLHPNSLLHNRGEASFADVTEEVGLLSFHPTQTAVWGDYDNDGWLDLFVGNESYGGRPHRSQLFQSNGVAADLRFKDVAGATGVAVSGYIKGAAWGDYDNDGLLDLYVSRLTGANFLFANDGSSECCGGWTFSDRSKEAGVTEPMSSFPTWFWDYDNDGWLDIFVSGYHYDASVGDVAADYLGLATDAERPRLYRNRGDGTFAELSTVAGIDKVLYTMGSDFGDLDNDGWLDLYAGTGSPSLRSVMPNRMFRNASGRLFQDVTSSGGFGHLQKGHGVAFGDLDNDGDQDIYAVIGGAYTGDVFQNVLFENPGHGNHWIALRLEGVRSNRAALGARIRVRVTMEDGPRDIYATVGSGSSFGGSSLQQEIGLGRATAVEAVEVTWPATGETQRFTRLEMDRYYSIREGEPDPVEHEPRSFKLVAGPGVGAAHEQHH